MRPLPESLAKWWRGRYTRRIAHGLERTYRRSSVETRDVRLDDLRLVLLSDAHKGGGDGADEFRRAERAYNAALAYYHELGFTLAVIGDAEELWKYQPEQVLDPREGHLDALKLEADFHADGRYVRIFGNHDDLWRSHRNVRKHLGELFPDLTVHEALKINIHDRTAEDPIGQLFLVHGHQGTLDSDWFSWLSHPALHYIVRPLQRKFGFATASPAVDWKNRRMRQDEAMFQWASNQVGPLVLIAGHTHRPIFPGSQPEPKLDQTPEEIARALEAAHDERTRAELQADLEYARAEIKRVIPTPDVSSPPCYFNTGCCCYGDGDLTAIEMQGDNIRLVRWPGDDPHPRPLMLGRSERSLRELLVEVAGAHPALTA